MIHIFHERINMLNEFKKQNIWWYLGIVLALTGIGSFLADYDRVGSICSILGIIVIVSFGTTKKPTH